MSKFWSFVKDASTGESELLLDGVIASESWWDDEISPKMFRDELAAYSGDVTVRINSPGGDVFAGIAIYNALVEHDGKITIKVDGLAASIASLISMAGDDIVMLPGSMMMVHQPWTVAMGNADEMAKVSADLKKIGESMIPIYTNRTGLSEERVLELLKDETYMTGAEAVELGFATEAVEAKTSMSASIKNAINYATSVKDAVMQPVMSLQARKPKAEEVVETPEEITEVVETPEVVEEVPTVVEPITVEEDAEEVIETPAEEIKPIEEEDKDMSAEALDTIVPVAAAPVQAAIETKSINKVEARKMVVTALAAKFANDDAAFETVAKEMKVVNVIDGTTGNPLMVEEVLAADIRQQYTNVGRVGQLVNRIDIEGAETFKQLVETAGAGFQPVALGGVKQEDQPVWTAVTFEPFEWALIVAWLDGVQKRSPIAVYTQIVRYIAKEYAKLEDKIVLTYAGGTYGGEARPATGLVPILTTAGRVTAVAGYGSADLVPALGGAYGDIESDDVITLVANRKTWAQMAVSMDANDNPIFNVVGEQVTAGALGSFRVVLSQVLADGQVVIGAFDDYNLVTRGGLETLFSREATIGSGETALNLFTQDASALRADVDITGGPVALTSFTLLEFATAS